MLSGALDAHDLGIALARDERTLPIGMDAELVSAGATGQENGIDYLGRNWVDRDQSVRAGSTHDGNPEHRTRAVEHDVSRLAAQGDLLAGSHSGVVNQRQS